MSHTATDPIDDDFTSETEEVASEEDEEVVEREQGELREFVIGLSGDDIKTGSWFTKLITHSLHAYTTKVN